MSGKTPSRNVSTNSGHQALGLKWIISSSLGWKNTVLPHAGAALVFGSDMKWIQSSLDWEKCTAAPLESPLASRKHMVCYDSCEQHINNEVLPYQNQHKDVLHDGKTRGGGGAALTLLVLTLVHQLAELLPVLLVHLCWTVLMVVLKEQEQTHIGSGPFWESAYIFNNEI